MKKILIFLWILFTGFSCLSQTEERIKIVSVTPSEDTGQDYSSWLTDDLSKLVPNAWEPKNRKYVDVTLKLEKRTQLTRLSLYDFEGIFTTNPASIYALDGAQKILLGVFTGEKYMAFVDMPINNAVIADAIIIHKYENNIPQKVKVFGKAANTRSPDNQVQSVISFGPLPTKIVGDAPFELVATSNNTATPITFSSSNPSVATVSNASGNWKITVLAAGTTNITASQAGNVTYLAASNVSQVLTVQLKAQEPELINGKIPVYAHRWYQLNNVGNGLAALFDGKTDGSVETGWGKIFNSYDAYYPLLEGEEITIEKIRFFDGEGSNADHPMTLAIINDQWQRINIATFTGEQYNQWVGPDPKNPSNFKLNNPIKNARYLIINATWGYPTEMELYGSYKLANPVTLPSPEALAKQKQVKLKQTFMVNAFEWDVEDPNRPHEVDEARLKALKSFTGIRHYMDWEKLEMKEGAYTFNPTHSGGWNYDAMYERLKKEGIEVLACLKTLPAWMLNTYPANERDLENVPVRYGKDFSDPKSYIEQAKVAFQFAARYGSNKNVNPALLRVNKETRWPGDGVNEVKIGLNYIQYFECENERDKWWKGRKAYQTGREYAANLSAFYDGHKNTMGAGVGVKNADPNMKVVMAGLASPSTDYVRGMIDWCKQYRGYKADGSVNLCWDVINYHLYSNDAKTSQGGNSTRGAAPEVSEAGQVAANFVQMAHQYAGGMPVWITETGYDTNQGSPLKAIPIGSKSVLETQADWILRTSLLYARYGVERVFMYQLYDDDPANPTQFSSSGLLNQNKTRKPAADYLYQVNKLLGEYAYKGTLNQDPIVDRYELNGKSAYALVVPDEKGRKAEYTLNLGNVVSATLYRPRIGQNEMAKETVATQNGKIKITVTETPIFVIAGTATTNPNDETACAATGTILREYWADVPGMAVNQIPVNSTPTSTSQLILFESSTDSGDQYGTRIRGYICPPQSGNYTFWIAGDDNCELWLSSDDNPVNKTRIAYHSNWTNAREWNKFSTQKSASINLTAGKKYYIEALQKEHSGGDNLAVAWQLPNGQMEAPIAGERLAPFILTSATSQSLASKTNIQSETAAGMIKVSKLTAYPNPFNTSITVEFSLAEAGEVRLEVYDIHGRFVRSLFNGSADIGVGRRFKFTANKLAQGIYIVKLTTKTKVLTQRINYAG